MNRRQLLQALGLGTAASLFDRKRAAFADGLLDGGVGGVDGGAQAGVFPSRIVFYVQPHGHIPLAWNMDIPGGPTNAFAERSLVDLSVADFSPTPRPLYSYRDRLLAIEGLSHTSALADIALVNRSGGGDNNNHQIGVADVLSGSRALQRSGTYCTGGARTLDQELATRLQQPGKFDSRVYGFDYIPNSVVSPFSYLGPGQATPMVSSPAAAFSDLLGYRTATSSTTTDPKTARANLIRALRPSVLDTAGREFDALAPKLGAEARQKLTQHRELIRELEVSLGVGSGVACNATYDSSGTTETASVRQFMSLIRMALACQLTQVITFSAPVPQCPELGYPADQTFHGYAHQSILGNTSCGQMYNPVAAQAMTDLDAWHAGHVAYLLDQLDSVKEGSGTLLDHTVVVWVTELATPTHQHFDVCTLMAGGCNGFFKTGRYLRYPRNQPNPIGTEANTGPAHNRLHVSLLQAMGQTDTSFGLTGATAADGTALDFTGPLAELRTT